MALTRYTLRQLEAFVAVAEQRSFTGAAHRMGLTAQAVSQLIAELEAIVDFRLFERTTRRVALSSAGQHFLGPAETVLRHVQAAEIAASDVRHQAAGIVRVGAPQVLAGTAIPAAIGAFQALRPRVVVRVKDLPVDQLVDAVTAGDVDLAVGPDRPTGEGVQRAPVFDSRWVLWCASAHPLARRRQLRWTDLHGHALVAAGRDHERSVSQMHVNAPAGARVEPVDVVDNVSTALGIAAQGLAATLAPAYVGVVARPLGLVMRRVVDPETVRTVCLYRSTVRTLPPAAEAFADHLLQWLPGWQKQDD
ncbi:LysR family transcriptional regulator [uncultured Pseudacidovorax sp.]|uniref:LysR family transcriptional regulator n=1 Tax=uncultured Pseudacidovorax sp. TaxID=679313 RepID=UPI0025D601C9|nr:LysR family transcriptional regulator [uncultured Pseudacidovorax sp.]